jgi:membrane protein
MACSASRCTPLLADPGTIRSHLETLSGVLPALSVIGDQITRVSAPCVGSRKNDTWLHFSGRIRSFPLECQCRNKSSLRRAQHCFVGVYIDRDSTPADRACRNGCAAHGSGLPRYCLKNRMAPQGSPVALARSPGFNSGSQLSTVMGPSRVRAQWRWLTWGSAFAAVAWLFMSLLFS